MNKDMIRAEINLKMYQSGAMEIAAPMGDKKWCIAALQHAIDAIKGSSQPESALIIPASDVQLP